MFPAAVRRCGNAALATASVLLWVAFLVRVAKSCAESAASERRRVEEARMLLDLVCSSARGASLAREFARCEEASVLLRSTSFSKLRVLDRALTGLFSETATAARQGGVALLQVCGLVALLAHAPGAWFARAVHTPPKPREEYSQMAQARLHHKLRMMDLKTD